MVTRQINLRFRNPLTALISITLAISLFGFALPSSMASAPKPGGSCSKAGKIETTKGFRFTCIKLGKRLIWDKGVRTTKKASTNSTSTRIPVKTPIAVATPISAETPSSSKFDSTTTKTTVDSVTTTSNDTSPVVTSTPTPTQIETASVVATPSPKPSPKPSPTPSPTPSTSTSATPTPTPTQAPVVVSVPVPVPVPVPQPVVPIPVAPVKVASTIPQIGKAGGYIYRYLDGKQERQNDDGEWYSTDGRAETTFDPIRVAAFKSTNSLTRDESHQKISFTYVIRDSYPAAISSTIRYQVEKVAKVFSNSLDQNLPVTVYMVTEQDRTYINNELPSLIPGFSPQSMSILDDYVSLPRFYSRGGTGGGQAGYIDQQGRGFYLANTSSLAELDTYWPEVPPHEMAHVFQFFFARGSSGGNGEGNPDSKWHGHLIEGSANTIGMALGFETLGWYHDEMDKLLKRTIRNQSFTMNSEADAVTLINEIQKRDTELRNEFSYAAGQIVWEYFIGKYGIEKFIELMKNVPRTDNFRLNIQATIGQSQEVFYQEAGAYLFANWKRLSP